MVKDEPRKWTILYYANGNNEYEPEMYKSLLDLKEKSINSDVDVLIEIGRVERKIAEIIRPSEKFDDTHEHWTGVRRYHIINGELKLIESTESRNMAHPLNLYNFIKWGIRKCPAKHYILILGGHGAAFVGTLTDYSQNRPYIMGTVEMCKAINMIYKEMGCQIDILLLDICYMNLVEIIYELGKKNKNTVQNVLTYVGTGPVSGLPYYRIFDILNQYNCNDTDSILKYIIDMMEYDLIAVEINTNKLKIIKRKASELAYKYLISNKETELTPLKLITDLNPNYPWHEKLLEFQESLSSIISYYKTEYSIDRNLLNIIFTPINDLMAIYYKLSFAKGNYWTNLLCKKRTDELINFGIKESFQPVTIRSNGLRALIKAMNPSTNESGINDIYNKIIEYKGWIDLD